MSANKQNSFARDSVFRFAPTAPVVEAAPDSRVTDYRTSVRLTDDDVTWLDCRCCELRRGGWHSISRSTIIRALVRAASDERLPMAGVSNEEDLIAVFKRAFEQNEG